MTDGAPPLGLYDAAVQQHRTDEASDRVMLLFRRAQRQGGFASSEEREAYTIACQEYLDSFGPRLTPGSGPGAEEIGEVCGEPTQAVG